MDDAGRGLLLAGTVAALIAASAALHPGTIDLRGAGERPLYGTDHLYVADGDRIHPELRPGLSTWSDGSTYRIPAYRVETNARGLREEPVASRGNRSRILVVGDSYVFGWGVNRSDRFADVLERRLAAERSDDIRVIAAGVPGWQIDDMAAYTRGEGLALRPDVVVLAVGVGDMLSSNTVARLRRGTPGVPVDLRDARERLTSRLRSTPLRETPFPRNVSGTAAAAARRDVPVILYVHHPLRPARREGLADLARETDNLILVPAPDRLETLPRERYTLSRWDTHYDATGHRILGRALAPAVARALDR